VHQHQPVSTCPVSIGHSVSFGQGQKYWASRGPGITPAAPGQRHHRRASARLGTQQGGGETEPTTVCPFRSGKALACGSAGNAAPRDQGRAVVKNCAGLEHQGALSIGPVCWIAHDPSPKVTDAAKERMRETNLQHRPAALSVVIRIQKTPTGAACLPFDLVTIPACPTTMPTLLRGPDQRQGRPDRRARAARLRPSWMNWAGR